jgi:hypothetical protein
MELLASSHADFLDLEPYCIAGEYDREGFKFLRFAVPFTLWPSDKFPYSFEVEQQPNLPYRILTVYNRPRLRG